jgi:hypothetical protein
MVFFNLAVNEEFEALSSLLVSRHQHRFAYQARIFDRTILLMCLFTRVAVLMRRSCNLRYL